MTLAYQIEDKARFGIAEQPVAAAALAVKIARIEQLHAENQADVFPSFVERMESSYEQI